MGGVKDIVVLGVPITTPTVSNVTSNTPDGLYGKNSTINISITFSENVTVIGSPYLELNTGGNAVYNSGNNTDTINFTYVVGQGDNTDDLDYTDENALTLNGSLIISSVNKSAVLTLPIGENSLGGVKDIVVDTQPPQIVVVVEGDNNKSVSADDGEGQNTTMYYKIQPESSCGAEIPDDALNYTQQDLIVLTEERYNRKYVCFWSEDEVGNVAGEPSQRIIGIIQPIIIVVSDVVGDETKRVSADDNRTDTTMHYKIRADTSCGDEAPDDAISYRQKEVLVLDKEEYNRKYVCFWSISDSGTKAGRASDTIMGIAESVYDLP